MRIAPAVLLFVLSVAFAPAAPWAMHPTTCPDGVYVVNGPPLIPGGDATRDAITIDHGRVSIESGCGLVPARITAHKDGGYRVKARWRHCRRALHVRLDARLRPGCSELGGRLRIGRPKVDRSFIATKCDGHGDCFGHCTTDAECGASQWCSKASGACDDRGTCRERRDDVGCPAIYDPVCGCDGETYGNGCEAFRSHANVAHDGACEIGCNVAEPCADGQFCELPPSVCASDLDAGLCTDVPEVCPEIYAPVCGCDGTTYSNDCERQGAQVSKSHDGRCLCPQILCAPGTRPVDRDGDGCDDACLASCETACDCYAKDLPIENPCPLMCPNCGNWWSCEAGACIEKCGPIPPQACNDPTTGVLMTPR